MARSSSWHRMSNFLRKYRKFPHSSFKTKWNENLKQKYAMEELKSSLISDSEDGVGGCVIRTLVSSFRLHNCEPTPQAYRFVIKTLAKTSQLDNIASVLNHLEVSEKFDTPESIFRDVISAYGFSGKIEEAVDVFFKIPNFRCVPSAYTLNALLLVLVRKRESLGLVPEVLVKASKMGVRLEESSLRILIDALCGIGEVDCATELVRYMSVDCVIVDPRLYSRLLSSVCKHKDSSCFDVLGYLEDLRKTRFLPSLRDYTVVMRFLVEGGRGKEVVSVLNQMKCDRIEPDIVCYTVLLQGVIADEEYSKADKFFDELLLLGLAPDIYTYNVYITGLCKQNDVEGALKMMYSMNKLGSEPNVITYNILIKGLVKAGDLSRAKTLWKEMETNGVNRNSHTYDIMISAFIEVDDVVSAQGFLEEAVNMNVFVKCSRTEEVISRLCDKGLMDKAVELLAHMV
ncbi:PREDICTED: pentatricopeptide repeat-containing protein At2g38420, mitochondrial-like isoform X1 [Camelina sativa]|uniref:Pentatricopeptide repeat-containing protein At2g38420, mitochondrial-like isoform X1 n=2 Tax=Camelina sativa TaxID=90675 RepID=A0ABM0YT31_CAMSA|nr:PREDICTED: pentatricopeptide repeat-containing protein At2g38420, mitochondrial-like isoform X1 [Camelina sativa]